VLLVNLSVLIKMFSDFSQLFSHYDLNKYYSNYEGQKINEIVETFKFDCNSIKTYLCENKFEYDSKFTFIIKADFSELEVNISKGSKYPGSRRHSDENMKESYKIMNEKIVGLKKLEFDFTNIAVFILIFKL